MSMLHGKRTVAVCTTGMLIGLLACSEGITSPIRPSTSVLSRSAVRVASARRVGKTLELVLAGRTKFGPLATHGANSQRISSLSSRLSNLVEEVDGTTAALNGSSDIFDSPSAVSFQAMATLIITNGSDFYPDMQNGSRRVVNPGNMNLSQPLWEKSSCFPVDGPSCETKNMSSKYGGTLTTTFEGVDLPPSCVWNVSMSSRHQATYLTKNLVYRVLPTTSLAQKTIQNPCNPDPQSLCDDPDNNCNLGGPNANGTVSVSGNVEFTPAEPPPSGWKLVCWVKDWYTNLVYSNTEVLSCWWE